ncbi:hypothetical protein RESH_06155 [Rhodopirellula europaea SH398]|uniref:Uncharacterized protein n=1 Tax=Rhodopirellula europaea SH398 TaxID=1263868 RepID=M5RV80_9BACT|nr:hypothetical protein RESH_06155 [Rhodopirellula europaea SH398]
MSSTAHRGGNLAAPSHLVTLHSHSSIINATAASVCDAPPFIG